MDMNLNMIQLIGIWLMVTGLILNTVIFVFSYYKVVARLKQNEDDTEEDDQDEDKERSGKNDGKSFPIIRFIFHFRKVIKDLTNKEKRENFELIVSFLKWALFFAVGMIAVGLVLFLIGFFF